MNQQDTERREPGMDSNASAWLPRLRRLIARRVRALYAGHSLDDLWAVLSWHHHSPIVTAQRARLIISRVRLVAVLFGVLTPLWIIIDLAFFPTEVGVRLALARLVTSAAFFGLAIGLPDSERLSFAWLGMAVMFLIPTVFFLYSHPLLSAYEFDPATAGIASGYAFLPFVMLAGLSVFPLSLLEAGAFAAPVLSAQLGIAVAQLDTVGWQEHIGAFWLLTLIATVAALASMSQLNFLNGIINRSVTDPLTGCYNRRSGEALLRHHAALAARTGQPVTVGFIDLDGFKSVNDVYGHEAGDELLQASAEAIADCVRDSDAVIRWGGEEFVLVLPNTPLEKGRAAFERLLRKGLAIRPDGGTQTASIGIAERRADGASDSDELVRLADTRMYAVKKAGGHDIADSGFGSGSEAVAGAGPVTRA